MKRPVNVIFTALLLSSLFGVYAKEDPRIEVSLERDQVYEGESVTYIVSLLNFEEPSQPVLEGVTDFDVEYRGENSRNSSQMSIINGRITRSETYCTEFRYLLSPRSTGTLHIPAPSAEAEGKTLRGRPMTLKVIGAEKQDIAFLTLEHSPTALYPLQP
ncbi:MAG: BatD family protein, partial [Planctomycetota bacterium]